ncbi:adenylate/guanylate cyclase domain-containing protein [uncultured Eudoraea sp.]|uniref:adenylate/guanylate cyclase domain-containing protein n=1 Tax=uncultured Eudoraea sp. TaxID=1035614 RepID=UPI002604F69E|nr:adenylate/guanylate cyclase domain-containing protein [uncultured Eudoraea sp.]
MSTRFFRIRLFKNKTCLTLGIFCFLASSIYGQNQVIADSLELIYHSGRFAEKDRLQMLSDLAEFHSNPEKKLQYGDELLRRAKATDSTKRIIEAYQERGSAFRLKGDHSHALESFLAGVKIADKEENKGDLGILYLNIGILYARRGDDQNAILNYQNAIPILKAENDSINFATVLENLGDLYNLKLVKPDSALLFFKESGEIYRALDYKLGIAYNLGNVGLAYALKGENELAEKNINQATVMLEELGDNYPISVYLTFMSDIYADKGDWPSAFGFAQKSLDLAKQHGLKEQIGDAYLKLSELHEKRGNASEALKYYQNYIKYRDSVSNIEKVREMANLRADFEVDQKQTEVDLLEKEAEIQMLKDKRQKIIIYATIFALIFIFVLLFFLYRRYSFIKETNTIIEEEKNRSDTLLLNILPKETAQELKETGHVEAKKFESVTVLFTDFKDFTRSSADLSPERLVKSVDYYFSRFDEVMEKHGLEKIKTMGDAYMCTGGIHLNKEDHAIRMVHAAFEIVKITEEVKIKNQDNIMPYEIRIGINTGPVIAGVVGTQKFAYDIWGDTVNVAARMETNSETGMINISENTYELIKDDFECEYRGKMKVKNKGMMKMYYVIEPKLQTA